MLKDSPYPEAAVPLAPLITDREDDVQLEAIAAELNIFLAEKVVVRKRVGFVVEVRNQIVAEKAFAAGPLAIGPRPVPVDVLAALRTASADDNPRVALEALYAFGTLAVQPGGAARRELLHAAAPSLVALTGVSDAARRYAAVRVLGRVYAKRMQDEPVDQTVGDAIITLLNDRDRALKVAAMEALGAMRYERSVQALIDLFQYYGKGDEAAAALDALARIGHASASTVFSAQLQSRNAALRAIAIEGLARIGDRTKLTEIESAIGSDRTEAVQLAGTFASAMLANAPIESITEGLAKTRLRDQAKQYLVELAAGRPALLTRQAQDPDARIRIDVADVLGLAGDPAALPLAESLLQDKDPQVARAAERAVARLKQVTS